jgi:hypothetical protein
VFELAGGSLRTVEVHVVVEWSLGEWGKDRLGCQYLDGRVETYRTTLRVMLVGNVSDRCSESREYR